MKMASLNSQLMLCQQPGTINLKYIVPATTKLITPIYITHTQKNSFFYFILQHVNKKETSTSYQSVLLVVDLFYQIFHLST